MYIHCVPENRIVKVFATYGHSAGRPNTDYYIESNTLNVSQKQTSLPVFVVVVVVVVFCLFVVVVVVVVFSENKNRTNELRFPIYLCTSVFVFLSKMDKFEIGFRYLPPPPPPPSP